MKKRKPSNFDETWINHLKEGAINLNHPFIQFIAGGSLKMNGARVKLCFGVTLLAGLFTAVMNGDAKKVIYWHNTAHCIVATAL